MTNIILDATTLTTLQACPRKCDYRFNHLLVNQNGKSNSLECGSLVHVILEYYNKALMAGANRNEALKEGFLQADYYIHGCADCISHINDNYPECKKHKDNDFVGMVNTPEESTKNEIGSSFVIQTMHEYFDYYRNDSFPVLGVEETRGMIIYEDDDLRVLWKAKFDLVVDTDHGYMSIDHKTMKQRRETQSLDNQFMGQCILLGTRSVMIDKIGFQKSLKQDEKFQRVIINYTHSRLDEWRHEIVPYYARMYAAYQETGYWPPNYTQCESKYGCCDFKQICESDSSMRELVMNTSYSKGKVWDVNND